MSWHKSFSRTAAYRNLHKEMRKQAEVLERWNWGGDLLPSWARNIHILIIPVSTNRMPKRPRNNHEQRRTVSSLPLVLFKISSCLLLAVATLAAHESPCGNKAGRKLSGFPLPHSSKNWSQIHRLLSEVPLLVLHKLGVVPTNLTKEEARRSTNESLGVSSEEKPTTVSEVGRDIQRRLCKRHFTDLPCKSAGE